MKLTRFVLLTLLVSLFTFCAVEVFRPAANAGRQQEIKIDPKTFDEFVGQYASADNPDFILSFFREGDKFFIEPNTQGKREILPESSTRFFLKGANSKIAFQRDAQGRITGLILQQNDEDSRFKKINDRPAIDDTVTFGQREEMIRMRDGVRLHTLIFAPKIQTGTLPIIISRTPYGIAQSSSDSINARYKDLVRDGYIFVLQDIRGRYGSEGEFMMNRPMHSQKDRNGVDESTDTYDTIEWLLKHVPKNNGKVGIMGVSYGGWLAAVATIDAHPALKASSPQAPMTDTWLGDDFFHNGAFRQSYG
jgi:uncharacterized protein